MPAPRPVYSASVDAVALTAATAKSVLEVFTPASTGIVPIMWWVEFDGVTATAVPALIEVGIFSAQSTAGTAYTAGNLLWNYGNRGLASQCTVRAPVTTEGAGTSSIIERHRVPPTSGILIQEPLGMEMTVGASSSYRIRVTAPAAVNATAGVRWTE